MTVINAQSLFNRVRMFMAGVTHQGRRDLYELFGWTRTPNYNTFVAKYYRMGLAKRIINGPVLATWGDPPQVSASNENFNTKWKEHVEAVKLWHHLIRLDKLAGLGRYAVMVVGFNDGGDLSKPLREGKGKEVLYLQPYHEGAVQIKAYVEDKKDKNFGRPEIYTISPGRFNVDGTSVVTPSSGQKALTSRKPFEVHHSRVVHVAENLLEDGVIGASPLECVNNDLDDIQKIVGGSAECFWLTGNRGMQMDLDKDVELNQEELDALKSEVDDYQHQLRRIMRTRGVKITELGADPPDPSNAYDVSVRQISAGTGIPQLVFQGIASGHLASQQDRASWAERVNERATEYSEPVILRPYIDMMVFAGILPKPRDLLIEWPEAFKMNPLERAQTSAQMARSAANLSKSHANMSGPKMPFGAPQQKVEIDPETGKPLPPNKMLDPKDPTKVIDKPPEMMQPQRPGMPPQPGQPPQLGPDGKPLPPVGQKQKIDPETGEPIEGEFEVDPDAPPGAGGENAMPGPNEGSGDNEPLFSREEMRKMVSFGKHPPVFDKDEEQKGNRGKGRKNKGDPKDPKRSARPPGEQETAEDDEDERRAS